MIERVNNCCCLSTDGVCFLVNAFFFLKFFCNISFSFQPLKHSARPKSFHVGFSYKSLLKICYGVYWMFGCLKESYEHLPESSLLLPLYLCRFLNHAGFFFFWLGFLIKFTYELNPIKSADIIYLKMYPSIFLLLMLMDSFLCWQSSRRCDNGNKMSVNNDAIAWRFGYTLFILLYICHNITLLICNYRSKVSALPIASVHGSILSLAACVLSVPYDMPRSVHLLIY